MRPVIPIFRMFDEAKAREFYLDFLGFKIDWEHRFDAEAPLCCQISKGDYVLHLSEHYGDAIPGSAVRLEIENVIVFQKELLAKKYKYARPGVVKTMTSSPLDLAIKISVVLVPNSALPLTTASKGVSEEIGGRSWTLNPFSA
ncbi:MAG: glyoxalase superfamily protein [Candidatus Zophobacter franzmannii]|nr:glyoxalase superfamily protein [Candidatus Zophobacter franzmannii]